MQSSSPFPVVTRRTTSHAGKKNAKSCTNTPTSSERSEAAADILIKRLDEKRQERWIETVESTDFTHSSRKAWHTINCLTGRTASKPDKCPVSANAITSQLVQNGRFTNPDHNFSRQVGKVVAKL